MKALKQSLFVLALIAIINTAEAQTKFGINAGVNFSKVKTQAENGNIENTDAVPGFQLGFAADIPVIGAFYIQPGILYASRGFKQERGGFFGYGTNFKVKVEYFEVPVNILYKPKLWGNHLFVGAGAYVGFGRGGNWQSDTDVVVGGDMVIGNRGDVIFRNDGWEGGNLESYTYGRPVDYGANFLLGYEFLGKVTLQLNAQFGMANLQPRYGDFQPDGKINNSAIGISLGYKF